jgi:SAM-dependent methyltransferase
MTVDETLPDHVRRNRAEWDTWAVDFVANGERSWRLAPGDEKWGTWDIPEREVHLLPDDLEGRDAIELGCGTGYISAWLARRGAKPVGIDNSEAQLATARRLQAEHGIDFPLLHGNAEHVPYPDASFDFAISEYGASIWADPYAWIPEASRLLRPGGRLIFLINATLLMLCMPDEDRPATNELLRPLAACTVSSGPRTTRSTSRSATATGSASCGRTASRSRTSSSCGRRPAPRPTSRTSRLSGRPNGPARRSGSPGSATEGQPRRPRTTTGLAA